MILKKITFNDFRQFYGEQEIVFSTDPAKNVTLIHAENGVGKTTILNAVLWAFFGVVTSKFEQKEKILNFQAAKENRARAAVKVLFSFHDTDYLVERDHLITSNYKINENFKIFRIMGGNFTELKAPDTFINSVIPKEMANYFFFDGESAEAFSAETNFKKVSKAIRDMLGCNLADTAIEDLKTIASELNREISRLPGADELQKIEKQMSTENEKLDRLSTTEDKLQEEVEAFSGQRESILAKLREITAAKEIQHLRDTKWALLKQAEQEIKGAQADQVKWIGQKAILLISRRITKETLDFIDEASLRGRIPSPYNEDFVKGLLQAETCICHRPLVPESEEWRAVVKLLKDAANAEILGRVVRARARAQNLRETASEAPRALENLQKVTARQFQRKMELEQEIGELTKRLEGLNLEEINEREAARITLEKKIRQKNQELGAVRQSIESCELRITDLQADFNRVAAKTKQAEKLLPKRDLAVLAAEYLKTMLADYTVSARRVIQKSINGILQETARRDYRFNFNENFSMELLFPDGTLVPRSSGENQLMSLVFITALIDFARLRSKASGKILTPGTVAPLVLDSPFGQLDAIYREDTAKFIPQKASQVVLLVSSSQGDEKVLGALSPYIGAQYVLISENQGPRGAKKEDRLFLKNKEFICSLFNCEKDLTRIERVL